MLFEPRNIRVFLLKSLEKRKLADNKTVLQQPRKRPNSEKHSTHQQSGHTYTAVTPSHLQTTLTLQKRKRFLYFYSLASVNAVCSSSVVPEGYDDEGEPHMGKWYAFLQHKER